MRKSAKWGLGIIIFCVLLIIFISILPESEEQKATKQQEKEKLTEIEQKIKAISAPPVDEFISISKIEDDGLVYRIWINLLFEPENYQQVQTWTDAVCESSKKILDDGGMVRSISIWANRPDQEKEGNVIVYGRTFYDRHTGKSEFKNAEELNL